MNGKVDNMKKWLLVGLCLLTLAGCRRYGAPEDITSPPEETTEMDAAEAGLGSDGASPIAVSAAETEEETEPVPEKTPVKVKGIYLSAPAAGSGEVMDGILAQLAGTEINAVVIDLKDDNGRVTCAMDSPLVTETEASKAYVSDMPGLIKRLKEDYGLYVIARVVAFRDPWLAEKKPEWCLKLPDGSVFRDRSGLAWINPYKQEVWDYLVEIGTQAAAMGFDEVQFDYIRFCTEKGVGDVVFDEADTRGRSKTDVITEFTAYAYDRLSPQGVFVAADVFGAIIGSEIDAQSVGQVYGEMASHLDYICPMIYPSHYGDGNFGIEHPDMEPYRTILAALQGSAKELSAYGQDGRRLATVRPWLQDFTASYLKHYIKYGPEEIRAQIQATYDAGYDEWLLWSAACRYTWGGIKSQEDAAAEAEAIAQSRAAAAESAAAAQAASRAESEAAAQAEREAAEQSAAQPEGSSGESAGEGQIEDGIQGGAAADPEAAQQADALSGGGKAARFAAGRTGGTGETGGSGGENSAAGDEPALASEQEAGRNDDGSLYEIDGPAPALESLPELPAHISPAGSSGKDGTGVSTVIPQMQMN